MGRIVYIFHTFVIFDEVGGVEVALDCTKIRENLKSGGVAIAGDVVAGRSVINSIDGCEELLFEGFVSGKELFPDLV